MQENVIYSYKINDQPDIILKYCDKEFSRSDLEKYYNKINTRDDFVEFLPGVYYKRVMKYKTKFIHKYYKKTEKSNLKSLLSLAFYRILDELLYEKQNIQMYFKILNKRDYIKILINDNEKFIQYLSNEDELKKLYYKNCKSEYDEIVEYKEVETSKIMYPFSPGGNGERCRIKGIFQGLDLLNGFYDNEYIFFNEHEMFLASSNHDSLMKECKKFEKCMDVYGRFENNTYIQPKTENRGDNIRLIEHNGIYKISNGNHRVCCAKRFKIPTVYAEVHKYIEKNEKETNRSSPNFLHNNHLHKKRYSNEEILDSFYNTLHKLGMNSNESKEILIQGLRCEKLVKYIEDTTGKTFYELIKRN